MSEDDKINKILQELKTKKIINGPKKYESMSEKFKQNIFFFKNPQ